LIVDSLRELSEVVRESIDVLFNVLNNVRVVNDVSLEVLESGACILGGEEEDWEDSLFAVFNYSHNAY
jgi:hypothetical protein